MRPAISQKQLASLSNAGLLLSESSTLVSVDKTRETLVSITLDVIDAKEIPVESLLRLRQDKTSFASELRQNYARSIQEYVDKMVDPKLSKTDITALAEDFRRKMEQDLNRLRAELKLSALKTVLSKESLPLVLRPPFWAARH